MGESKIKQNKTDNMSFEEIIAELENISNSLRSSKLTLNDAVAMCEKGSVLSRIAEKQLAEAELKINKVGTETQDIENKVSEIFSKAKFEIVNILSGSVPSKKDIATIITNLTNEINNLI